AANHGVGWSTAAQPWRWEPLILPHNRHPPGSSYCKSECVLALAGARLSGIGCLFLEANMKRREFITALGGAAIWPLAARAEQARKIARIGYLAPAAGPEPPIEQAFTETLQQLGWVEGQNITIEYR